MQNAPTGVPAVLEDHLKKDGFLLLFKLKNNRVDYSMMNAPPELATMRRHLATVLVHAGSSFTHIYRRKGSAHLDAKREKVVRMDGREITYDESIDIDWTKGSIVSTQRKTMVLKVLSIVIQDLVREADADDARNKTPHHLN